jgi:hypothetical protein
VDDAWQQRGSYPGSTVSTPTSVALGHGGFDRGYGAHSSALRSRTSLGPSPGTGSEGFGRPFSGVNDSVATWGDDEVSLAV